MPLSEHEQQMLAQLERQLHEEDPRLATQLADDRPSSVSVKRIVLGAVLALVGLGVILLGVSTHLVLVGILGMALLAGGILVLTARSTQSAASRGDRPARGVARRQGSFMSRLERDWDERRRQP